MELLAEAEGAAISQAWHWLVHAPEWGTLADWFSAALGGIALIFTAWAVRQQAVSNLRAKTEEEERQVSIFAWPRRASPATDSASAEAYDALGVENWLELEMEVLHCGTVPVLDVDVILRLKDSDVTLVFALGDVVPGETRTVKLSPAKSTSFADISLEFRSFSGQNYRRPIRGALEQVAKRAREELSPGDRALLLHDYDQGWWDTQGDRIRAFRLRPQAEEPRGQD